MRLKPWDLLGEPDFCVTQHRRGLGALWGADHKLQVSKHTGGQLEAGRWKAGSADSSHGANRKETAEMRQSSGLRGHAQHSSATSLGGADRGGCRSEEESQKTKS